MRLIDADALEKRVRKWLGGHIAEMELFLTLIDDEETISDKNTNSGNWIEKPFLLGTSNFCSICGSNYGMPHEKYNYCPNCGAKME